MPEGHASSRPTLIVLASTYPRWRGDHEPGFVHELAKRLVAKFHVIALVPCAPGAAAHETLDGVEVVRYRYAPRRFETLVNDGGIVTNLRRHHWKILLVPTFVLSQAWRILRLVCSRRVDVIHAHWLLPQGLIVATLGKFHRRFPPYLVTSHGADLFALRGRIPNVLKRFVVRRAAVATVVSHVMRDELEHIGADASKVMVQSMGVDLTDRYTPDLSAQRSHDEILFVGRLVEKKGLRYLIDAMPAILNARPTAYLTVVGFGPEQAERRAQVEEMGLQAKVHFMGPVQQSELPGLYRRAAVFVAPFVQASSGDQEGLGLVLVEAAGCGCPVVASDLRAVASVLDEALVQLVRPGSADAISDAVCASLAAPPVHDGASQARSALCKKFDWREVAASYAAMLRDAAIPRQTGGSDKSS